VEYIFLNRAWAGDIAELCDTKTSTDVSAGSAVSNNQWNPVFSKCTGGAGALETQEGKANQDYCQQCRRLIATREWISVRWLNAVLTWSAAVREKGDPRDNREDYTASTFHYGATLNREGARQRSWKRHWKREEIESVKIIYRHSKMLNKIYIFRCELLICVTYLRAPILYFKLMSTKNVHHLYVYWPNVFILFMSQRKR